jgi:hypothetical protein
MGIMTTTFVTQRWESGVPERDAELKTCELRNRAVFGDGYIALGYQDTRTTFGDLLSRFGAGLNIAANSDIYLTSHTVGIVSAWYAKGGRDKVCMALSRWDDGPEPKHHAHKDSQDAWIFSGRVPKELTAAARAVPMGVPGCDNRLARIIADHGYEVINPSRTVRTYHVHGSGYRTYGSGRGGAKSGKVEGPYLLVPVIALP